MKTDKIYLVGFMASGKTTVAKALGKRLAWRVEDIDELIETSERQSIANIFSKQGEAYFRTVERETLLKLLRTRHTIIATGGGTFVDQNNRTMINQDGISIWLDVAFDQIIVRLPSNGRRPLAVVDRMTLKHLYEARATAYQHAHIKLDATHSSVEELVEKTLVWLEY